MDRDRLYYKYSHMGCPAAHMEDNCAHPDRCADNGRCIDLGPCPFDHQPTTNQTECAFCGKPTERTWNFGGPGGWDVCEACANIGECDGCGKQNVARRIAGPILACEECQS